MASALIVGDIGGTHLRLALKTRAGIRDAQDTPTASVSSLEAHVAAFCSRARRRGYSIEGASLAAAGIWSPARGGRVCMTNASLVVDARKLAHACRVPRVIVINDFQALAYSVNALKPKDVHTLRSPRAGKRAGARIVVGPGSGLGMAILIEEGKTLRPLASEGGHADIPLITDEEQALGESIRKSLGLSRADPISYEHLLSGPGLERIYAFLSQGSGKATKSPSAKRISETYRTDPVSGRSLRLFAALLARCCRNFALEAYASGGLFLAGGVVTANLAALDGFAAEFSHHPDERYAAFLRSIPIDVLIAGEAGLAGAAYAFKRVN